MTNIINLKFFCHNVSFNRICYSDRLTARRRRLRLRCMAIKGAMLRLQASGWGGSDWAVVWQWWGSSMVAQSGHNKEKASVSKWCIEGNTRDRNTITQENWAIVFHMEEQKQSGDEWREDSVLILWLLSRWDAGVQEAGASSHLQKNNNKKTP